MEDIPFTVWDTFDAFRDAHPEMSNVKVLREFAFILDTLDDSIKA